MTTEDLIAVEGKRIVLAGALSMSRARLTAELEARGATVESKVSRATDLVVKGEGGAPTLFAAKDKGVRVVDEEALLAVLGLQPDCGARPDGVAPIEAASLNGQEIVITGQLAQVDRNEAAQRLALLGAKVATEVTAATHLVFAGAKAGANLFHAREHGVRVVDEEALISVLAAAPELRALSEEERREEALCAARERAAEVLETLPGAEVVIAGPLGSLNRANVIKRLEHFGARTTGRVTRSTRLLVAGESKGPNYFLAKQQRTPIIDETVLAILFERLPPAPDETADTAADGGGAPGDGSLDVAGKKVLIAGTLTTLDRVEAKRGLERAGAEVVTKMDTTVQLVVVGEKGGRNLFLAKELGLPLMDEDGLRALLERIAVEHPETEETSDTPLELRSARVVLAGTFAHLGRVEARRALEHLGAEVVDQVDETVRYVVAGERGGRNLLLARQLGLPLIDEPTLRALLEAGGALGAEAANDGTPAPVDLSGATVAFTGSFADLARTEVAARLAARGAEVAPGVTPGVRYLLVGEGANAAQRFLARKLKIPELAEPAWRDLLRG